MAFKRRRGFAGRVVKRARRAAARKGVKRVVMNMAEKKYFTQPTLYANTDVQATWTIQSVIAGLVQGTAATQRIGNKIQLHRIDWVIKVMPQVTTMNSNGSYCDFIVYHNKRAQAALPTGATMFLNDNVLGQRNQNYVNSQSILKRVRHTMGISTYNAATAATSVGPMGQWNFSVYPKKRINFVSNAGTISDIQGDDYGVGFCADAAACCKISISVQVIFSDA